MDKPIFRPELRSCPNGCKELPTPLGELPDRYLQRVPGRWLLGECPLCRLVYLTKIPRPLSDAYPDAYWRQPENSASTLSRWAYRLEELYRTWALGGQNRFLSLVSPGSTLLEIGGGDGRWAQHARKAGLDIWMMEADPRAAKIARARGISAVHEGLADAGWEKVEFQWERVDGVVGFHVLEHMENPNRFLRDAADKLRPGSLMILQTPNLDSWQAKLCGKRWIGLDIPRHLNHFTPDTLGGLLRSNRWMPLRWYHYSRRDSAPGLASSLALWLNPARPSLKERSGIVRLGKGILFGLLCTALKPFCWLEAALGHGGVMTVIALRSDKS